MQHKPGARLARTAGGGRKIRFGRAQNCAPLVFMDGVQVQHELNTGGGIIIGARQRMSDNLGIDELPVSGVAAIEIYDSPAHIPPEYNMTGSVCGVILLWTGDQT